MRGWWLAWAGLLGCSGGISGEDGGAGLGDGASTGAPTGGADTQLPPTTAGPTTAGPTTADDSGTGATSPSGDTTAASGMDTSRGVDRRGFL